MKYYLQSTLILILFLYPIIQYNAQVPNYNWRVIKTGYDFDLLRITFSDSLHGWAMGYHNILHTENGGETWIEQPLPADTLNLREISFLNVNIGYTIGENGLILATKNGGSHWLQQQSGANKHYLMGISFIDENTGWLTGEMDDGVKRGGILLHTTNGGIKWDTLSDRSDMILYYDVKFADENNGIVIGSYGFDNFTPIKVYRTYDGGKYLTEISEFSGAHTRYLFMNNIDTLWTGLFGFAKSFDGGFTWDANYSIQIKDSAFYLPMFINLLQISGKTGWAIVYFLMSHTELYYTDDYAFTWKLLNIPEDFHPLCITSVEKYLFVGGAYGLIMTNKPSTDGIDKEKQNKYTFNLLQNYPNPFNPSTIIKFALPKESDVQLIIYDIIGKEIKTLTNGRMSQGTKEVVWNGTDNNNQKVSSGVYIYRLRATSVEDLKVFDKCAKLVLLK